MDTHQQRIAIVCFSHSLGGLELSSLHLAEIMQSKGASALLVVPPKSPLEERAAQSGVETSLMMPRWKYFDLFTALKLYRVVKEHRTDVVVLMRSQDINLASIAKIFFPSVKLVFYQQMRSGHNKRDWMHTWLYSKLSLWIALTQGMKDEVLECTRMREGNVTVVPLGTDLERFDPGLFTASDARAKFALPNDKKIIGVLGRLDPGKGQEVLIRAIPEIIREHSDVLILIAGDETAGEPGYKRQLESLCSELGVGQFVRFMNFTDDVPRLMAALDILALPSFSETFGLVVIEAMAMEKTVIATNAGGVPEIITDNVNGLLVEPRDAALLARAINRVLGDREFDRSIAHRARAEAVERYDMNHCVDALLAAISAV